ncbi:MAG: hypothetical protein WA030_02650 [Candidatus Microsaccharimonas sp.]
MKNMTVGSLFKPLIRIFTRFHLTMFIVFIVAGLSYAVLMLNYMFVDTSSTDGYTPTNNTGSIDQATLDRIKQLHTSDETIPALDLSNGRTNPFGE